MGATAEGWVRWEDGAQLGEGLHAGNRLEGDRRVCAGEGLEWEVSRAFEAWREGCEDSGCMANSETGKNVGRIINQRGGWVGAGTAV